MRQKPLHVADRLRALATKMEDESQLLHAETAHLAAQRILELEATVRTLARTDVFACTEAQRRDAAWLNKYATDITEGGDDQEAAEDAAHIRCIADRLA